MADDDTLKRAFLSYIKLRRVLGILGVLLPFILAGWGFALCECVEFQGAISDYYALRTRDALVGILFAIAWFLLTYRGYEKRDDIAGDLACVSALGVALFPSKGAEWEQTVHYISAASLFLVLSYFSLRLFTKTDENRPLTAEKRRATEYIGYAAWSSWCASDRSAYTTCSSKTLWLWLTSNRFSGCNRSLYGPSESPGSSRARPCGRTRERGGESPGLPDRPGSEMAVCE